MNSFDAYKTLELNSDATEEQIKKQFRKLAAKYHPDVNKDPEAESKFKQINEAYNVLTSKSSQESVHEDHFWSPFTNININGFGGADFFTQVQVNPISIDLNITFAESILGTTRKIPIERNIACNGCSGRKVHFSNEYCKACNGRRVFTKVETRGNSKFQMTGPCIKCQGTGRDAIECTACSGKGTERSSSVFDVKIPGGIVNNSVLNMRGAGDWVGMGYADAYLKIQVEKDPDMSLRNQDVISTVKISLLESLKGTKKTVRTVCGDATIDVKPGSRNKDEITIPNYGVNRNGNHVITLDVELPEDTSKLIQFLENN